MKKIIIIIGVVIVIAAIFILLQRGAWETYENSRFNFSLKYLKSWRLGSAPTNNDGQSFTSANETITCRAFGFYNSLMNEQDEPQTLEQHIDWLLEMDQVEPLARESTTMAGQPAIELVQLEGDAAVRQSVYILDAEKGYSLECVYDSLEIKEDFQNTFQKMLKSFIVK
ncbi:hypothetical protein KJ969_04980 [Patescibacteria group bacterium]|nr:hypothetical protein [Patescibacteria group bacterium]MBU1922044.1 hypothetical protein [Patescibacteria group bacterium]